MELDPAFASTMLVVYPERNPFDVKPPVPYLSLLVLDGDKKPRTPGALTGLDKSVLAHHNNPLIVHNEDQLYAQLPLTSYQRPSPLPKAEFEGPIEFLEQFHPGPEDNSYKFRIRIGNDLRFLKVVRRSNFK